MNNFEILIASHPDKENLVAEIWYKDVLIAEINQEKSFLELELLADRNSLVPLDEFLDVVENTKRRLA